MGCLFWVRLCVCSVEYVVLYDSLLIESNLFSFSFFSVFFFPCRDFLALKVYVALCYYKLDYYDVSQEVLAVYLQSIPDSTIALNLKACNHFKIYKGKAAEVPRSCMSWLICRHSVSLHFMCSHFCVHIHVYAHSHLTHLPIKCN